VRIIFENVRYCR